MRWASTSDVVSQLRRLSALPYGMLLVTGPTGSGKTTTLYAAISETHTGPRQDRHHRRPGGIPAAGRAADPVNEKKGLTFRLEPEADGWAVTLAGGEVRR